MPRVFQYSMLYIVDASD